MLNSPNKIILLEEEALADPVLRSAIEEEVERILASDIFINTTRLKRFFTYIVDQTLLGNAEQLKGYNIGLDVFDQPKSFNPTINTNVRVNAMALRRRLSLFYMQNGDGDTIKIHLKKGSYVPGFELCTSKVMNIQNQNITPSATLIDMPVVHVSVFQVTKAERLSNDLTDLMTEQILFALGANPFIKSASILTSNDNSDENLNSENEPTTSAAEFMFQCELRQSHKRLSATTHLISNIDGSYLDSKTFSYATNGNLNNDAIQYLSAAMAAFAFMVICEVFTLSKMTNFNENEAHIPSTPNSINESALSD